MLLKTEVNKESICVEDRDSIFCENPRLGLWRLVQEGSEDYQPIWENIITGELCNWGTHRFTTVERIERQFKNIEEIDAKRQAWVRMLHAYIEKNRYLFEELPSF